jgi:hypothetical protein
MSIEPPRGRAVLAGLSTVAAVVAAVVASAGIASATLAKASGASSAASVVISPLPGTPDADPDTQVSFLGAPADELHNIVVAGSASGRHSGRLESYSTGTGESFLPTTPFDPGELVTVSATVVQGSSVRHIGSHFAVSTPFTLTVPPPQKLSFNNVMQFQSRPDLEPPAVDVTTPDSDASAGDIFVAPNSPTHQNGPMILAPTGQLVWFDRLPYGETAFDLNVQSYQGTPVLTWWQGQIVDGHGQGVGVIANASYQTIATVRAGNGLHADLHDFDITPQGTAWITAFAPVRADLQRYGGPVDGVIADGVVQEIDIKTGLVMFQWNALGHVALRDSYMKVPTVRGLEYDYFHINSIDPEPDGNLLISSRNTWAVYSISAKTGAVLWRLGGKHSTFKLGVGVQFAWQHDAELLPDGTISIFDNEDTPREATQSRAVDVAINSQDDTATLVWALTHPGFNVLSAAEGNVQTLPDGNVFVGWGDEGDFSELSPTGQLLLDMHFVTTDSYRAFRYPWSAQPPSRPALVASAPVNGTTQLYASWNGATDVAGWSVLAGASSTSLSAVASYPATGFETAISAPTTQPDVQVQALSATGAVLASSPVIDN